MQRIATALVATALLLSACDGEITRATDPARTPTTTDGDGPTTAPTFPVAPSGSGTQGTGRPAFEEDEPGRGAVRESPLAIGSATPVDEWLIRVIGYDPDATEEILEFNAANDPPPEGHVYAMARLQATWGGEGNKNAFLALEWGLVDDAGTIWTDTDCAVLPDDLANQSGVPTGSTAEGTICFVIDEDFLDQVVLYVAPLLGEPVTRRWWQASPDGAGTVAADAFP